MTRAKAIQALFAVLASVLVVACVVLLAWKMKDWVPLALLLAAFAALFTLAAWRMKGER